MWRKDTVLTMCRLASVLLIGVGNTAGWSREPDAAPASSEVVVPTESIQLFNGKDLTGWYSFLLASQREDPLQVFQVRDGTLRISGEGLGYLSTRQSYRDYHLVVEYRWGERNWGDRVSKARDSGVFLHSQGPDGNSYDGQGAFKAAIECQVMEAAVGDVLLIKGRDSDGRDIEPTLTATALPMRDREGWPVFDPAGTSVTLRGFGRLNRQRKHRAWKDVEGIRDPTGLEHELGAWNRIECVCRGDHLTVVLNGQRVNQIDHVWPNSGPILLQCEGSEIFYRRVELRPIEPVR